MDFYALCRSRQELQVRSIPFARRAQDAMRELFSNQEADFLRGREEEVPFDGRWKPDRNELMVIRDEDLTAPFLSVVGENITAFAPLNLADAGEGTIKAIFAPSPNCDGRVLVQRFTNSQYLRSDRTYFFSNDRFESLENQGFTIDSSLVCIVEDDAFKFDSFWKLRNVVTIQHHFTEATREEVEGFLEHGALAVEDQATTRAQMDETCRRLIRGISRSRILDEFDPEIIADRAMRIDVELELQDGRILIPTEKPKMKLILRFLEESVYKGVFSEEVFVTNSKRPAT